MKELNYRRKTEHGWTNDRPVLWLFGCVVAVALGVAVWWGAAGRGEVQPSGPKGGADVSD